MLGISLKNPFRHPNPRLQFSWNCTQLGLLLLPLFPTLGAVTLGLALLTGLRQFQKIVNRPINQGFALLGIILIIVTIFAQERVVAVLGLFNLLPFFLAFMVFGIIIQTTIQLRKLSWILVTTSLPIVLIGFGQLFFGWSTPAEWENIFGWTIIAGGNPVGRMASVFMYANIFAGYLTIVFILGLGLWLEYLQSLNLQSSNLQSSNLQSSNLKEVKPELIRRISPNFIFLTIAVIINFVALILTNSRNAWVTALLACFVYAINRGWRILVAAVTGFTSFVLLAAFAPLAIAKFFRRIVPEFLWARLNDQMYPDRPVELMRTTQWRFAWSLTQERPWTGWGLRNFTALYQAKMQIWLGHPHNLFLMLSAETGLPATIIFCSLIIWILVAGIKVFIKFINYQKEDRLIFFSYLVVLGGLILFNTVDVSLFDLRLNTIFWLLMGAVSGVTYRYQRN
ncbi:O-antigen ligase family protein [Mastigocoleus testarum]|uniref:Polymerase n=1 Tax=Mastigocoleus testarum BC008 TaxID=371196 RepID=A0A0V7ZLI0_9CYAN|nr:O-antigen ligase family protein [Mastigocoleus testarum]KST65385.1 polymerase [Mastigocoleus testarum BC008]KST70449.1 polymerase [Mastigocoleus testarum BC008]